MIDYTGGRTLDDLIEFVETQVSGETEGEEEAGEEGEEEEQAAEPEDPRDEL